LTDVILLFGEAEHNSAASAHLYTRRYSQWQHPNHRIFISLERHLQETGHMKPNMPNTGRPQSHRSTDVGDLLHAVEQSPGTRTRQLACYHISQWTVVSDGVTSVTRTAYSSSSTSTGLWALKTLLRMATATRGRIYNLLRCVTDGWRMFHMEWDSRYL
jgi:hypothetical protein